MTSTVIFVEILFAGIQSMVWIVLLIFLVFGAQWLPNLDTLPDVGGVLIVIGSAFAYSLGIVNDRMARIFFDLVITKKMTTKAIDFWLKRRSGAGIDPEQGDPKITVDPRMTILVEEKKVTEFLNYLRSRLRIARSTVFNSLLTMLAAWLLIFARSDVVPKVFPDPIPDPTTLLGKFVLAFVVLFIGTQILATTFVAFAMLRHNYNYRKDEAVEAYEQSHAPAQNGG